MAAGKDCSQHSLRLAQFYPVSYVPSKPGEAVIQFVLCIKTCWFCTLPDCVSFGISKLFNSLPVQLGSLQQPTASIKLWLWFHSTECPAAMAAPGTLVLPAAQFLPWWLPPHHTQATAHAIKTSPNCSKTAVSCNQSLTSSLHCVPSPFPNLLLFFQTSVIFTTMLWCECETFLQRFLKSHLSVPLRKHSCHGRVIAC